MYLGFRLKPFPGHWFPGAEARYFSFNVPRGKDRGFKISVRRLRHRTAAGGVDCHHSILSLGKTRERSEEAS